MQRVGISMSHGQNSVVGDYIGLVWLYGILIKGLLGSGIRNYDQPLLSWISCSVVVTFCFCLLITMGHNSKHSSTCSAASLAIQQFLLPWSRCYHFALAPHYETRHL